MTKSRDIINAAAAAEGLPPSYTRKLWLACAWAHIWLLARGESVMVYPLGMLYIAERSAKIICRGEPPVCYAVPAAKWPKLQFTVAARNMSSSGLMPIAPRFRYGKPIWRYWQSIVDNAKTGDLRGVPLQHQKTIAATAEAQIRRVFEQVNTQWLKSARVTGKAEMQPLGVLQYHGIVRRSVIVGVTDVYVRAIKNFGYYKFRASKLFKDFVK